jgi:serine/threonine protein kinase
VSQDAIDFIDKLLVVDKEKRMKSDAALAHPWLNKVPFCISLLLFVD